MAVLVGIIITIISVCIIAFFFWYNHFYMIAFGRGLPEVLFHQRMIATVIESAPFLAFIYLVFTNPIFRKDSKKIAPVQNKWSLAQITIAFVCVCFLWPWLSSVSMGLYFHKTQKGSVIACNRMETDAQNTAAAVADYYADPEHTTLPTVARLIEEGNLSTYYPVTIEEDANGEPVIMVFDEKGECPNGKKYVFYSHGIEREWKN